MASAGIRAHGFGWRAEVESFGNRTRDRTSAGDPDAAHGCDDLFVRIGLVVVGQQCG